MKRRDFIVALGSVGAWPLHARAQQPLPVVGLLRSPPLASFPEIVAAFRAGLTEAGFVDGQNVTIDARSADNQVDRLPALVTDLIARPVAVIAGDNVSAIAAKAVTTTVPIVVVTAGDPVRSGLVASINRPGGNVTGVSFVGGASGTKRLELLRQVAPKGATIAVLVNPDTPTTAAERGELQAAAQAIGQPLLVLEVTNERELEAAFATIKQRGAGALLVGASAFLTSRREWIVATTAHYALPSIYVQRAFAAAGGLMSYGASVTDAYRQAGIYAARVVKGEKPADLPVMQSSKLEFVINLKTAKMLGLEIPDRILALADEVIE
jgi:putative ABC transport system substrate-binding protein